jgi:hypothetical protein
MSWGSAPQLSGAPHSNHSVSAIRCAALIAGPFTGGIKHPFTWSSIGLACATTFA